MEITISNFVIIYCFACVCVAMLIDIYALVVANSLAERVWSLDTLTITGVSFIAVYSYFTRQPIYYDIALALMLVSFLATVVFSRFMQKTSEWTLDDDQ